MPVSPCVIGVTTASGHSSITCSAIQAVSRGVEIVVEQP
jgi:hypothetical protein